MRQVLRSVVFALAVSTLGLFLIGCESTEPTQQEVLMQEQQDILKQIREDPSPQFVSTLRSDEQLANYIAINDDLNWRQLVDDWFHFWLTESQRLTPYPQIH